MTERDYEGLSREELIRLLLDRDADEAGGLRLHYKGQTAPWRIVRRVQPRRQKIETKLSCGTEEEQSRNAIVEGENLQGMVSLYKYRGQVDLILTDPPYNTGSDFRYNDADSDDPGQRFRSKPDADSNPSRTPIPIDPGQGLHRRGHGVRRWLQRQASAPWRPVF